MPKSVLTRGERGLSHKNVTHAEMKKQASAQAERRAKVASGELKGKPRSSVLSKGEQAGEGKLPSPKEVGKKIGSRSSSGSMTAGERIGGQPAKKAASSLGKTVGKVARAAGKVAGVVGTAATAVELGTAVPNAMAPSLKKLRAITDNAMRDRSSPSTRGKAKSATGAEKKAPSPAKKEEGFGSAFRAARNAAAKAGNADSGVFEYKGKKYNTKLKK